MMMLVLQKDLYKEQYVLDKSFEMNLSSNYFCIGLKKIKSSATQWVSLSNVQRSEGKSP